MTKENIPSLDRGRDAVKAALLTAAREMLSEMGPNAMSVRSVAAKAGVNHGQVQHYFGGKQGLIKQATRDMAQEHFDHAHERAAGRKLPLPLTLAEDPQYLRSIVRLVLDGDIETATQEIEDGISIPIEVRNHFTRKQKEGAEPADIKARLALSYALEMGWAALEPYVLKLADVSDAEIDEVRAHARQLAPQFLQELET